MSELAVDQVLGQKIEVQFLGKKRVIQPNSVEDTKILNQRIRQHWLDELEATGLHEVHKRPIRTEIITRAITQQRLQEELESGLFIDLTLWLAFRKDDSSLTEEMVANASMEEKLKVMSDVEALMSVGTEGGEGNPTPTGPLKLD